MKLSKKGLVFAILSSVLWGFSGNITEYIYDISNIDSNSLVTIRMFLAGLILSFISFSFVYTKDIKEILSSYKLMIKLVIFTIFGVIMTQLPFFYTIKYSSAPFATLMQFLTPLFIIIYVSIVDKIKLTKREIVLTVVAFIGVFLILTNGNIYSLHVSVIAIFWGLLAAIGFAFYLLYSKKFKGLNKLSICGFSMVLGGIILSPFINFNLLFEAFHSANFLIALLLNVIIGTVIPFYLFLLSLEYIPPRTTSLLQCFEPLTAIIVSYIFFDNSLGFIQLIGGLIIILTVMFLTYK